MDLVIERKPLIIYYNWSLMARCYYRRMTIFKLLKIRLHSLKCIRKEEEEEEEEKVNLKIQLKS